MSQATLHTNHGQVVIRLFDEDAPKTVDNFLKLSRDGFYDGLIFHRVIPDFMIQGGCPEGTGTGGPGYTFEDELNDHKIVRGALAMANAGPNPNGSQFFVVTTEAGPWLDGKPATGQVITHVPDMNAAQVEEMASRARKAQPAWEALGFKGRAEILYGARDWLVETKDRMIETLMEETGKTREDALIADYAFV